MAGSENAEQDFFISYSNVDSLWAEWIAWQLVGAGYTVIHQAWDFRPGSNFVLAMDEAATRARRTIAVISPDYFSSDFTQPEWAAAFAQDPRNKNRTLIPVRVRKAEIRGLLRSIVYVDLVGLDENTARDALLSGVKAGRAKPERAPEFPGERELALSQEPLFPGDWPLVWNVTFLRNPNFTGRETLLARLKSELTSNRNSRAIGVLYGLGGIGKTQIVLEYAYRQASEYYLVWWVHADKPATLATDYANLASAMNLPEMPTVGSDPKLKVERNRRIDAVRHWLERNEDWLLVFDNAENMQSISEYLPRHSRGHILITSRNPNWLGLTQPVAVVGLDPKEAADFLVQRTGIVDRAKAEMLAFELGYLPLALEQAGAYIEETAISFSEYLDLFRTKKREILRRGKPATGYPDTVATTWEISFRRVENTSAASGDLLKLCAFFAPEDIPLIAFVKGCAYLPESLAEVDSNVLLLVEARAVLRSYSLISVSGDALSLHRLVQAVIIDRLDEDHRKDWAERAVRIANETFSTDRDERIDLARLLPHAIVAVEKAQALRLAPEVTGQLMDRIGLFLVANRHYGEAKKCFERALALYETSYGQTHPKVATVLNNLGSAEKFLGELEESQTHLERALSIDEAAYGPSDTGVAVDLFNLALTLFDRGDKKEAHTVFERAIRICTESLGKDHPDTTYMIEQVRSLSW